VTAQWCLRASAETSQCGRHQWLSFRLVIGDILQPTHLLFILVVALLVLGPKRLPEVGRALGRGIRDFRHAINSDELHESLMSSTSEDTALEDHPPAPPADPTAPAGSATPTAPAAAPDPPTTPTAPAAAPDPSIAAAGSAVSRAASTAPTEPVTSPAQSTASEDGEAARLEPQPKAVVGEQTEQRIG
jgi:sec-independent protein translocase protein TatA